MTAPTRICLICGTPADGAECDRCVISHDQTISRLNDI
jgi:hypothetical protein